MNQYIIEAILGLLSGIFLGITGILPVGVFLIILDYLNIGDYRSNLGAILFLNLFPYTIGSIYEFYKTKKINYRLGWILLFSIIVGSYIGSKYVVGAGFKLSIKQIKYISAFVGLIMCILFFISAYYETD
jgi:uncharacterized membrane protein YfcA